MAENLTFNLGVDTNTAVSEINTFFRTFEQGAAQASSKLNTAFGQKIQTEVEINLKGGELVAKKIEKSNTASKKLKDAYRALNGEIEKTPAGLKKQLSILKTLQGNTEKYKKNSVAVTSEWRKIEAQMKKASSALRGMSGGGGISSFLGKLALVQTAANLATAGLMAMGRAVADLVGTAGRMEVLTLQLEAFTGGTDQAEKAFKDFAEIAAKTPFNLEQVASAGKIMMAFGLEADNAVLATDQLSIVAAATGGDIQLLARNLGQVAAQGQAYTRDLTQFAIQGIPIWDEMSKVTGKSVKQLKAMAADGAIGFELVQQALSNMSAEGSKFKKVADEMQTTFAGRLAKIESSFQMLAKAAVDEFNRIDQAMGGVVSGGMTAFADGLTALAANLGNITNAILDLMPFVTALGVVFAAINFGAIKAAIAAVIVQLGIQAKAIWANVTAQYALLAAMGPKGWAIMAGAAAITGVAMKGVSDQIKKAKAEQDRLTASSRTASDASAEQSAEEKKLSDALKEQQRAIEENIKALELKAKTTKVAADAAKAAYDEEKEALDALVASVEKKVDKQIEANDKIIESTRDRIEKEKAAYETLTEVTTARYDKELSKVKTIFAERLRLLDLEADKLSARTPSEQKLYELEKKELQEKIKSGKLDERALLEAQARLERMEAQEKLQKLSAERKEVEAQQEAKIKRLEEEKAKTLEEQKTKHEAVVKSLESEIESIEKQNEAYEAQKAAIREIISDVEEYNGEIEQGISAIRQQTASVGQLEQAWRQAADQAARAKREAQAAKAAQAEANASGGNDGARASGGPVTGGSTYTVNELGKEAFLSASGALSMIKAPAYGQWKAPSSGTVIPAHLTKQLSVPSGSTNINSTARSNGMGAGSGGSASMVRAIQSAMSGGDTISNNVTIQAQNPVQAASDMMVQMNRVRRRRYT